MTEQYRDYKREAYERYINGLDNPIGSVMEFDDSVGRMKHKYSTDLLDRHAGQFIDENPALKHLAVATNKQDVDALYERAVDFDIKNYILQEQRDYDLPENEIKRQRDAGINVDLTGSGSGSGGIGSGNAQMQTIEGQTKFSNSYDNTHLVFEGLNTAANMVSTFTGGFGSIVEGISKVVSLPSQVKLNETTSNLQSAQANEINQMLSGKKTLNDVSASNGILQSLAQVTDLIPSDSEDSAVLDTLKSLNLGQDDAARQGYLGIVRQFQSSPEKRAKFANATVAAAEAEERARQMTPQIVSDIVGNNLRTAKAKAAFDADHAELTARVERYLNQDTDYSNNLYKALDNNAAIDVMSSQLDKDMLKRDVDVYLQNINDLAVQIEKNNKKISQLKESYGDIIPSAIQTWIDALEYDNMQLSTLGSSELSRLYDLGRHASKINYMNSVNISDGKVETVIGLEKHTNFVEYMFTDILTHQTSLNDVGMNILNMIPDLITRGATKRVPRK